MKNDIAHKYIDDCDESSGGNAGGGIGNNSNNIGSNGGGGNIINAPSSDAGASCFEISSTFYIPSYNQGYIETVTYFDTYTESTNCSGGHSTI